jgi:hypothetical protein
VNHYEDGFKTCVSGPSSWPWRAVAAGEGGHENGCRNQLQEAGQSGPVTTQMDSEASNGVRQGTDDY